jgi:hypothetical protein
LNLIIEVNEVFRTACTLCHCRKSDNKSESGFVRGKEGSAALGDVGCGGPFNVVIGLYFCRCFVLLSHAHK